jgi:hypothetical protein
MKNFAIIRTLGVTGGSDENDWGNQVFEKKGYNGRVERSDRYDIGANCESRCS